MVPGVAFLACPVPLRWQVTHPASDGTAAPRRLQQSRRWAALRQPRGTRTWLQCSSASLDNSNLGRTERLRDSVTLSSLGEDWVEAFTRAVNALLENPESDVPKQLLESLLAPDARWSGDLIERATTRASIIDKLERAVHFWECAGWYIPPNGVRYRTTAAERTTASTSATIHVDIEFMVSGLWPLPWRPRVASAGTLSVELELTGDVSRSRLRARNIKDRLEQATLPVLTQLVPSLSDFAAVYVAPMPENDAVFRRRARQSTLLDASAQRPSALKRSPEYIDGSHEQQPSEIAAASPPATQAERQRANTLPTGPESVSRGGFRLPPRCYREPPYRPYVECFLLPGMTRPASIKSASGSMFPVLPAFVFNFSRFRNRLVLDPQQFAFVTPVQVRRWLLDELDQNVGALLDRADSVPAPREELYLPEAFDIFDTEDLFDEIQSQIASWSSPVDDHDASVLQWRIPVPIRFGRGRRVVVAPHPYADALGRGETPSDENLNGAPTGAQQFSSAALPRSVFRIPSAVSPVTVERLERTGAPPLPSISANGRVLVRYALSEGTGCVFFARRFRGMLTPGRLARLRYDLLMDLRLAGRVPAGWLPHESRWRLSCYDCSVGFDENAEISVAVYRSSRPLFCIFELALEVPRAFSQADTAAS